MALWAPPGSSPGSQPSSLVKSYQRYHSRLSSSDGHVKPVGATPPSGRRSFQGRGRTASALVESPVTDLSDSVVPCVGFDTPRDDSASVEAGIGASSIRAPPGLLSRQLSPQKSGLSLHFGRCVQDEPQVVSPSGYVFGDSSGGSAAGCAEALSRAQALYPVFLEPVVTRAYTIAAWAHEGQTRKSGDPVMVHCLETAILVAELGAPADVVAAALLHDVLDDTMLVAEDLERLVPSSVFRLVKAVSRISYISQMHRDSTHGRPLSANALLKLRNMLLGLAQPKAVLIKLADRLHNMRTIHALPFQKQMRIADETLQVFTPLASRLGIWSLKSELEDLCFKALHTEEFYLLREKLHRGQDSKVLQGVLEQISTELEGTDVEVHDLAGRPKNLYSIFEKTRQKGKSLDEVYDIRAVRIVVGTKQDCYTVLRALERQFETVEGRFKDYIRAPKANGYSSLHCVIRGPDGEPVEVQIRSLHMHFLAEYGLAAHWRYKEKVSGMSEAEQQLVHYYRWVYSWELELLDKKCRPFGSPSRDDSLKRFGSHMACRFPKHRDGCSFETYISRSLPVHPEVADSCPVYVLFSLNDGSPENGLSIRQLPPQCTVGRLLRDAPALLGVQLGQRHALLVNQEEAVDPAQVLGASDHVEVVEQGPFERPLPDPVGSGGGGLWAGAEAAAAEPASASLPAAADEALAGQGAELETHVEYLLSSGDLQRQRQRLTKLLDWPQSSEPQRALTGVAS